MEATSQHERELRAARNQSLFRSINGKLESMNEAFATVVHTFTIACECAEITCVERIEIVPEEYRAVRAQPRHFAVRPGHVLLDVEERAGEGEGHFHGPGPWPFGINAYAGREDNDLILWLPPPINAIVTETPSQTSATDLTSNSVIGSTSRATTSSNASGRCSTCRPSSCFPRTASQRIAPRSSSYSPEPRRGLLPLRRLACASVRSRWNESRRERPEEDEDRGAHDLQSQPRAARAGPTRLSALATLLPRYDFVAGRPRRPKSFLLLCFSGLTSRVPTLVVSFL
jgi:hypothetical protein